MFTKKFPVRAHAFTAERLYSRRMQCTYGWDWVPRFVTMGIFGDVYIRVGNKLDRENVYVYTKSIDAYGAQVVAELTLPKSRGGHHITARLTDPCGETVFCHSLYCREEKVCIFMDVPKPQLWFPNGYGSQPLYDLCIEDDGEVQLCQKVGIVTSRISCNADAKGSEHYNKCLSLKSTPGAFEYDKNEEFSGFELIVNGVGVMCKGANWVPCEPFPSAESHEKIRRILEMARDASMTMLRVWGGGIFEQDFFYDECDRLGIMVTQDFLMACGNYPEEDEAFLEALRKEAKHAALRLRNHPCLMWWTGDNENAVMGHDGAESFRGRAAALQAIGPVLYEYDRQRRFLVSSPWGGKLYASKTAGTTHNTQFLEHYIKDSGSVTDYKEYLKGYSARFIAEEPAMGASEVISLLKMMREQDIYEGDIMWRAHTKSGSVDLFDFCHRMARDMFGEISDGEDRLIKLQYLQYEWIRVSMENARRNRGFCNGILYWMLNDCWPAAVGWSVIDYYCYPKAAFYSFKRCAKPLIASVDKSNGSLCVYVCNDSIYEKKAQMSIKVLDIDNGSVELICSMPVCCSASSSVEVKSFCEDVINDSQIMVCELEGCDRAFYKKGKLEIVQTAPPALVSRAQDNIKLRSDGYIHIVRLEGECLFEDNYFSLMPGEERTVGCVGNTKDIRVTAFSV